VVAISCHEPAGALNPPANRYHVTVARCNNSTNGIDAREAGVILRWVIEHYGQVAERKVFFIHYHDRAWHIPMGTIWDNIARVVARRTFWVEEFGYVARTLMIYIPPRSRECTWIKNPEIIPWLFRGTSMAAQLGKSWEMVCCSTFWLNTDLLWQRPRQDYVRLLQKINTLMRAGFCAVFNWSVCHDPNFQRTHSRKGRAEENYLLGQTMEGLWGIVLANRTQPG
jgi:hypothetical protein